MGCDQRAHQSSVYTCVEKIFFLCDKKKDEFNFSYTTLFNESLPYGILPIDSYSTRFEDQLQKTVSEICSKYGKLRGRKKQNFINGNVKLVVLKEVC